MLGVASDCAHHQCQAASPGVEYPAPSIALRPFLDACCQTALYVFDLDEAYGTKRAFAYQEPCVAGHRVRRVAVRDREETLVLSRAFDQVASLREVMRDGLVADDVEAGSSAAAA